MVLRKPYALLIRYFQRIHLLLILISAYIFYKFSILQGFVRDFINTESYNAYYEPISNYINLPFFIALLAVIIISIVLIVLLIYKKKPWKIYLLPVIEYIFTIGLLIYITSYFNRYNELSELTGIMAAGDLLTIVYFPQFLIFILFGIRFLGIDLKRFGFKEDEEYLDINEEDREEFEINIEFDKDKITRLLKKFWRNVKYVYAEHKLICNTLIIIAVVSLSGYTYYYFGVLHRTYKEGNTFSANYYDITINSSYLTERESNGAYINKDSNNNYLIINLTVKNNASRRNINIDRFRVMNKSEQFRYSTKEYAYFKDLGRSYDKNKELETGDEVTFILVYKVPKDMDPNKYVLYYHDVTNNILLKKTKLSVKDVRDVKTVKEVNLNEQLSLPTKDKLTITSAHLTTSTTYGAYSCAGNSCGTKDLPLSVSKGQILELSFASNNFDGESFVDFSSIYARIKYEDSNGKTKRITTTNIVNQEYFGNYAYFRIPSDIAPNSKVDIIFTFRDQRYIYHLI